MLKSFLAALIIVPIFLAILVPIVSWFLDSKRKWDKLNATAKELNLALKNDRAILIAEEERAFSGRDYLPQARIGERIGLLDAVQKSLNQVRSARGLKAKGEAVERAERALRQQRVCAQSDKAEELDRAAQAAFAAKDRGEGSFPLDSLLKIRDLTASAKRELDATNPKPVGFSATLFRVQETVFVSEPAEKALRKARRPLAEAEAIATEIGLLPRSPDLGP